MPKEPTIRLRLRVGRYAGHVQDFPKSVAENLLATGQAEYPSEEGTPQTETATAPVDETPESPQAAIHSVDFASAAAAEFADDHDLTDADFEGIEPSGKTGYTKADAVKAAESR